MPTTKDIQVILTTPTIQKNLNVAVPMFPNTDQVLNISTVSQLVGLRDQKVINEYFNEKFQDIDLVFDQKLSFVGTITDSVTTTDLLQEAITNEERLFVGNFWIVKIPRHDQISIMNVVDEPEYDLRDEEGEIVDVNESIPLKNGNWIIYTNKQEFQKIAINQALDYQVEITRQLANATGALTQDDVNRLFDKQITRNTIKTVTQEPEADQTNGEYNNLWFEIIDEEN